MGFKKRNYTDPVICKHDNDVTKDWYVFFQFKHDGKVHKVKRREGINRLKELQERIEATHELLSEIKSDLKHGWNPFKDPKREYNYLKDHFQTRMYNISKAVKKKPSKEELKTWFNSKGLQ
jgi:hypothetical protein